MPQPPALKMHAAKGSAGNIVSLHKGQLGARDGYSRVLLAKDAAMANTWANTRYPRDADGRIMPRVKGPDRGKPDEHPPPSGSARRLPTSNTGSNTIVPQSDMPVRADG